MENEKKINVDMENTKKGDILNAAITEFSQGYEKASTGAIVKAASVSKGLLFHFFGTKKDLFIATYEYAVATMLSEFHELINLDQKDLLERWRQSVLLKMDLMRKYPKILEFLNNVAFIDNEDIKQGIAEIMTKYKNKEYPNIRDGIDLTLFREDIDVDAAIQVIFSTMESYAQRGADPTKSAEDYYGDYNRYMNELETYIQLFRKTFYR